MKNEEFYKAPPMSVFLNIKAAVIKVCEGYPDPYRQGKITTVMGLENIQDNAMVPMGMLDGTNQTKAMAFMSPEALKYVKERLWQ